MSIIAVAILIIRNYMYNASYYHYLSYHNSYYFYKFMPGFGLQGFVFGKTAIYVRQDMFWSFCNHDAFNPKPNTLFRAKVRGLGFRV